MQPSRQVSAFPDIGGMSAYPDFPLVEDDFTACRWAGRKALVHPLGGDIPRLINGSRYVG